MKYCSRNMLHELALIFSVPSIMRTNRYRRDQRQLDEEEEMWFNEEDDFDEGEAVVPAANSSLINKKLNNELEAIGKMVVCRLCLLFRDFLRPLFCVLQAKV